MAQIRWTAEAATWLEDIFNYIAQDNPEAAANVIDGIYEKVQLLAKFPAAGHVFRREPEGDIRVIVYGHYRIAYLHRPAADVVEVLGVFHGALDISRYL
jgi:plasmid stabilization system protein ParE